MSGVVMVDSGGANIASVRFALERLGIESSLTADPDKIARADKVILPGVGTAQEAMRKLDQNDLAQCLKSLTIPVLGICLGMQLLFQGSEEGPATMLGILESSVRKFTPEDGKTIPHMGWNTVERTKESALLKDIQDHAYFYFVHSYFAPIGAWTSGQTTYFSEHITATLEQDNFFGCQFHPERSGAAGAQIFKNFMRL